MDTKRVLYFLSILARETTGHTDELAEIYNRAISENDDIVRLNRYLEECSFYGEIGHSLRDNAKKLKDQVYASPGKALELIPQIKQVQETIANTIREGEGYLLSPLPFTDSVIVIRNKDTIAYMTALRMIAGSAVYLLALYGGVDAIRELSWNDTVGIQEMIYAVNTKFLPALCAIERPYYSWVIRKRKMGGKTWFGMDCFYLSYESTHTVETLCSTLHKEPIGTHAFLNVKAYETDECDVPYCWGIGNLVSATPANALQLLSSDVITKVRSPQTSELARKLPTPMECIRQLTNGAAFCVSPDELLLAMNQWQIGHEIEKRKRTHNCLFCGKHVNSGLVCRTHFSTELR